MSLSIHLKGWKIWSENKWALFSGVSTEVEVNQFTYTKLHELKLNQVWTFLNIRWFHQRKYADFNPPSQLPVKCCIAHNAFSSSIVFFRGRGYHFPCCVKSLPARDKDVTTPWRGVYLFNISAPPFFSPRASPYTQSFINQESQIHKINT